MDTVICKEVIISTIKRRGTGRDHSPIRAITEVYEKDGTLIAEFDPTPETFTQMDLIHFARWLKDESIDPGKIDVKFVIEWLNSIKS
jgi:hypothetical protein